MVLRPALPVTSTLLLYRFAAVRHRSLVAAAGMAGVPATFSSATAQIGGFLSKKPYAPPSWATHLFPMPSHTFSLGHFPTPIHKWNLPNLPEGTEVWIKVRQRRDDLSGMQLSGNKVRKLEFLMADAVAQGADCIITVGGIQSNHCRATAVAAKYLNLDCYLILRTSKLLVDKDPGLVGNLLVERLVGAHIDLVSKEEYGKIGSVALADLLKKRLLEEGRKPYVIPVGGSNSLGTWGYIEAIREIEQQIQQSSDAHFDDIVVACGSGGTIAGLALGSRLSTLKAKVHAFSVCDDPEYFYDCVQGLIDGFQSGLDSHDIVSIENAKGLGYAMNTAEELKFVKDIAAATGIVLDPVYSGKAAYGLLKDMAGNPAKWKGRKILFVHTGGLLGLYDKADDLSSLAGSWRRMDLEGSITRKDGTASSYLSSIPELVRSNYKEWRNQLDCVLVLSKLDTVLTTPCPARLEAAVRGANECAEAFPTRERDQADKIVERDLERAKWQLSNKKCLKIMRQRCLRLSGRQSLKRMLMELHTLLLSFWQ